MEYPHPIPGAAIDCELVGVRCCLLPPAEGGVLETGCRTAELTEDLPLSFTGLSLCSNPLLSMRCCASELRLVWACEYSELSWLGESGERLGLCCCCMWKRFLRTWAVSLLVARLSVLCRMWARWGRASSTGCVREVTL